MDKNYFLYIIPNLPKRPALEASDWKKRENEWITHSDPYSYITYTKEGNFSNIKVSIFLREFPHLNSLMAIIECLDSKYKNHEYNCDFVDKIFNNIIEECKIVGITSYKKYLFKTYRSQIDFCDEKKRFSQSFLFSETLGGNELHQVNLSCFILKINREGKLNEFIIDNIFTLIALSEIAHELEHHFLKNPGNVNQLDVIKTFWGYNMLLLTCPASKVFPSFFEYNISAINNWLDECQMWLAENQNTLLKQIHSVEGGILLLTLFVIIDVLFTIFFELTHSFWYSFFASLISLVIYSEVNPIKKFLSGIK